MKVALISDIHGHALALEAVLTNIASEQVDQIICLGDTATLGPQPVEALIRLRQLGCLTIFGNHEAAVLQPDHAPQYHIGTQLIPALKWCRDRLSTSDLNFLRSLPATAEIILDDALTLLCYHGSPTANTDQILSTTPDTIIAQEFGQRPQQLFVGGHTHIQMLRQYQGKLLINPGSVGNVFPAPAAQNRPPDLLPWAEYAVITTQNGTISTDLRRVPFDVPHFISILQASDLPIKDWWLSQYT